MKFLILVLMFFIIGALLIINNNGLMMSEEENLGTFYELYVKWLDQIYANTQTITGDVIRMDWVPK